MWVLRIRLFVCNSEIISFKLFQGKPRLHALTVSRQVSFDDDASCGSDDEVGDLEENRGLLTFYFLFLSVM